LWMSQIARNLTDSEDGILNGKRYLIHVEWTPFLKQPVNP
jgi:hypothetical protein